MKHLLLKRSAAQLIKKDLIEPALYGVEAEIA
jgi:hypothetical protein